MVVGVVYVPEANDGKVRLAFVTATQDTQSLRQPTNSASVGVGTIGSVTLPLSVRRE